MSDLKTLSRRISRAFEQERLLKEREYEAAVLETIDLLDRGAIRVAEKKDHEWLVHEWIKKAILLYFRVRDIEKLEVGSLEFYDKIPLKKNFDQLRVRVVPPGVARYGSYLAPGVVLMPGYVNIGAYVDSGSMVDTHATVGSCGQVGKNVHLAGAARIGGVLEPPQSRPVIVEDNVFVGSGVSLLEGVLVREEAVLGAGLIVTGSTRILDVSGSRTIEMKGEIPPRSVVIPGSFEKEFPAGVFHVPCALIIGKRKASTDKKVSLNQVLRDFNISV